MAFEGVLASVITWLLMSASPRRVGGMKKIEKVTVTFELSKDALMLLAYAIPRDQDGDPFKDIYEMEVDYKHRVDDVESALKELNRETGSKLRAAIKALPGNGNLDE